MEAGGSDLGSLTRLLSTHSSTGLRSPSDSLTCWQNSAARWLEASVLPTWAFPMATATDQREIENGMLKMEDKSFITSLGG